jgi:(p)ppGpp synthase/HD superfamily hydrolase
VKIVTEAGNSPSLSWMNFAITGRARSHIRAFLNSQSSAAALKIGKKLLKQEAKAHGFRKRSISNELKQQLLSRLALDDWDDLLIEIGRGHRIANLVLRQLFSDDQLEEAKRGRKDDIEKSAVIIKGTEGLVVNYSRCCCPIPGDPIAGVVTIGSGLVIHNIKCPNFLSMQLQVDKSVPVEWGDDFDVEFPVKLRVFVRNQRSMFAKIATIIAEQDCNILEVETAESTDEFQPIDILIQVKNRIHLAQVIKQLRHDDVVQRVLRKQG